MAVMSAVASSLMKRLRLVHCCPLVTESITIDVSGFVDGVGAIVLHDQVLVETFSSLELVQ